MLTALRAARPQTMSDYPPIPGFVGWWDADDPRTIVQASTGKCSTWINKGTIGTLTMATDANRPLTGVHTVNGRNVLFARPGTVYSLAGTPPVTATPYTVFAVAGLLQTDAVQRTLFILHGATGDGRFYRTTTDALNAYAGTALSNGLWRYNRPHVISGVFNGASSSLSVDGGAPVAGTTGVSQPDASVWNIFGSGLSENWQGWIAEMLFYTGVMAAINIQQTDAWLRAKWLGW